MNNALTCKINSILIKKNFSCHLLTKINLFLKIKFYLGLIKKILNKNLQILILIPSLKNAYKILFFLKKYFNIHIDIIHSKINHEQYLVKWIRTQNGKNSIIIGTKKSIFFPFLKLGLIIVLEEHHIFYKDFEYCRYNVRNVGIFRAYKEKIPIILDSNTPSLRTLYNVIQKKCILIFFEQSYNNFYLVKNNIIDLSKERIKFGLSTSLIKKIYCILKKKYSVLLIFNKLDFIFLGIMCRFCKWIATCNICNNYLETKKYNSTLFCQNCLISFKKPFFCYKCQHFSLIIFNFGIKKIKESIKNIFPKISLLFLLKIIHKDTKKICTKHFTISTSDVCIIIAIRNVAQNYFFPNVRLIGLINIDYYLNNFNLDSIECLSQIYFNLTHLIGKNSKKLEILIQTFLSKNEYLMQLCNNEYFSFIRKRLSLRKKFAFPPWSYQAIIYSTSKTVNKGFVFLNFILTLIKRISLKNNIPIWSIGPYPICMHENQKIFSYRLFVQCYSRIYLKNILQKSIDIIEYFSISQNVKWFIDFNMD